MRFRNGSAQNDCPNCKQLSALLEAALESIADLQRRVEQLESEGKRQAAPFRRPADKRKQSRAEPGRKKGHKPAYRQPPASVDEFAEVPLQRCPHCGGAVSDVRALRQIIEDIAPVHVHRLHLTTYRGRCPNCGPVSTTHPAQVSTAAGAAGTHIGKRALALAAALNKQFGLTMRKTTAVLDEHFGLRITPGGLSQAVGRVAEKLSQPFAQLCRAVGDSEVIYADETGWWVDGRSAWLWTFTNPQMTLYTIGDRSQEVIRRVLGDDYKGVLVSDCLASYDPHPGRKSKCCAHHLKAIGEALQAAPGSEFLTAIQRFFKAAMFLSGVREQLDAAGYWKYVAHLERSLDALLAAPRGDAAEVRIANRLRKQRPHLLTFLYVPAVDATNNLAERQLRGAVIARKLSCGNKTWRGAASFGVIASVAATCRQQSRQFVEYTMQCLSLQRSPPPLFAGQ